MKNNKIENLIHKSMNNIFERIYRYFVWNIPIKWIASIFRFLSDCSDKYYHMKIRKAVASNICYTNKKTKIEIVKNDKWIEL